MMCYADRLGGSNGDGAWRGPVTIVEFIDPRPYILKPPVHSRLIYTVIYMSGGLMTQAVQNPILPPPPELRRPHDVANDICRALLMGNGESLLRAEHEWWG